MRLHIVWKIVEKELRETLRDRRTLTMMVLIPLLLYPLLILGLNSLGDSQRAASDARASKVAVWGDLPKELEAKLKAARIELLPWAGASEEVRSRLLAAAYAPVPAAAPRKEGDSAAPEERHPVVDAARPAILRRDVDAVLVTWPDVASSLAKAGLGHVAVLFDSVRPDSEKASDRVKEQIELYRVEEVARREKEKGLEGGFSRALEVRAQNVAPKSRRFGFGLGQVLPFLLVSISFTGAFYAAIDSTAGEKERGTLQTLLCAPLRASEIVCGKFLAVWTVAMISAAANILSMALTFSRLAGGASLSISPWAALAAFALLIPLTLTVVALFIAVAMFAKDFKDGQNFLTPVLMLLMVPSSAGIIPGIELNAWTAMVPVVNVTLLLKALFVGEATPDSIFLVLLGSFLHALLAILLAARIFEREVILLGGSDSWRGLFGIEEGGEKHATPTLSFLTFALMFVTAFYGSLALVHMGGFKVLLIAEYGFFLAPAIVVALLLRLHFDDVFRLRLPSAGAAASGLLIGLSGWVVVTGLSFRLLPPPDSLNKALEKILMLDDPSTPLWLIWLAVAATPAVCEELVFRGLILSGFRGFGMWPAILTSSLLFALAHASIYRLLPTFLLGIAFGYLAWRSGSIVPGMIAHGVNNGVLATISYSSKWISPVRPEQMQAVPWSWMFAAALVVMLAWAMVGRGGERKAVLS